MFSPCHTNSTHILASLDPTHSVRHYEAPRRRSSQRSHHNAAGALGALHAADLALRPDRARRLRVEVEVHGRVGAREARDRARARGVVRQVGRNIVDAPVRVQPAVVGVVVPRDLGRREDILWAGA